MGHTNEERNAPKTYKTTVNLPRSYKEMLKKIEERWGTNQTSVIQLGIILAHEFYFKDKK